jgi:hypothetical protein
MKWLLFLPALVLVAAACQDSGRLTQPNGEAGPARAAVSTSTSCLVTNGSFETGHPNGNQIVILAGDPAIPGWEAILFGAEWFSPTVHYPPFGPAQDGLFVMDLNTDSHLPGSGGGVQQTIPTTVGQSYDLSFYAGSAVQLFADGSATFEVLIDGVVHPYSLTTTSGTIDWTPFAVTFEATAATTTIAFRSFDPRATSFALIDNVCVQEVAPTNQPPEVDKDADPVAVDEGQTANNTGTVSDPDGDVVTLTASVGTITNNNDGTWSWSFGTSDGPAESQTVTIDADDGNGGTAQTSFTLTVNNVAPTVTSLTVPGAPVAIGDQPISASGTFTDPALTADETYTCTVDYGDSAGPLTGTVSSGTTCTGPDQTYAEAGIYTVSVEVTDKDGGSGSLAADEFIVIYDPSGGFVTGGGWIDSPAGAYMEDASLTGKANFGFVSKYKKGATTPTGNTEFQFKAGDLNFHSSSYDWLVITGSHYARFKGSGTINGIGDYRFMLWAGDDAPDKFRIKIWYEDGGEVVVYDNGFDQAIGGGSIVIHTKKQ